MASDPGTPHSRPRQERSSAWFRLTIPSSSPWTLSCLVTASPTLALHLDRATADHQLPSTLPTLSFSASRPQIPPGSLTSTGLLVRRIAGPRYRRGCPLQQRVHTPPEACQQHPSPSPVIIAPYNTSPRPLRPGLDWRHTIHHPPRSYHSADLAPPISPARGPALLTWGQPLCSPPFLYTHPPPTTRPPPSWLSAILTYLLLLHPPPPPG